MLEKTFESPLDCEEIPPVHPQRYQSWIFTGGTDAPILWPPDGKSRVTGKDPDAGKEKGMIEDETVRWHHGLSGHELEWTLGYGEGQRSLACCSPWGHKNQTLVSVDQQQYSTEYVYVPRLLYPFICQWTSVLAIVNSAVVNVGVHVSFAGFTC